MSSLINKAFQKARNEKRTALQEDLVKIAAGDAPLMILEKELNEINSQTEQKCLSFF